MILRPAPFLRGSAPRRPRGQGLTEYAVIVFLVAVGTLGVVGLFGDNLRQLFGGSAESIAGQESVGNDGSAPPADVLQWSMKGRKGGSPGNPGGTANRPSPGGGQPGGGNPGGGNPGGTTNSDPGGGTRSVD